MVPIRTLKIVMKKLIIFFFAFAISNVSAQTKNAVKESKFDFNQKLADSLGADAYGMKNYMLVILKTGPQDQIITDKVQRQKLFEGHFSNMNEMEKLGKLKMAGPFATNNSLSYRGIFILDVASEEEAKTLLNKDPTIKNGIFEVIILPWYGSAALPMHLPYHKKVAKQNP